MSTVKSKNLQVGTDATASNNFTIYQPSTPDGTLRIGVGNADSPTEVGRFNSNGYVATNAPAFSAYDASLISLSNATNTKITYTTEDYDTNNNFASSTFTPTVAGYYQINTGLFVPGAGSSGTVMFLYKNGAPVYQLNRVSFSSSFNHFLNGSALIYMNGSTDYLEIYVTQSSGGTLSFGNGQKDGRWFNGFLARAI